MPGTVANPVRLQNVFRRIVEVGWPSVRYIAVEVEMSFGLVSHNAGASQSCSIAAAYNPALAYGTASIQDINYTFDDDGIGTVSIYKNGAWQTDTSVVITGMPTIPTSSYADWVYNNGSAFASNFTNATPKPRWIEPAGTDSTVPVPVGGGNFVLVTSVDLETMADIYTSGPTCLNFAASPTGDLVAETNGQAAAGPGPSNRFGSNSIANYTFPVSGVVATFNGKTYSAIGSKIVGAVDYNPGAPGTAPIWGSLYILLERDPPTP